MSNDGGIEIRIGATIDSSLQASTKDAINQLSKIADAASALDHDQEKNGAQLASSVQQSAGAAAEASARAARAQAESWKTANGEIVRAEDSLIGDIFNKRQKLGRDLLSIGRQFVVEEIESVTKYWTTRELLALEGVEKEKAGEQGGFAVKLMLDALGLASTTAHQAGETEAVTAAVAAQTAAKSAGNAVGKAVQAQTASSTIAADANMAYSGTMAAVSQIPLVGPFIAPAAATAVYADVMAHSSIASAAGGQWQVGHDEQITALHKDEMVWPGWAAEGARNMLSGFASGGFSVAGGDAIDRSSATQHNWNFAPTIHGVPERDVMKELRNNAGEFLSFVRGLSRNGSMKFG